MNRSTDGSLAMVRSRTELGSFLLTAGSGPVGSVGAAGNIEDKTGAGAGAEVGMDAGAGVEANVEAGADRVKVWPFENMNGGLYDT
jgi:hypothetical protein